MKTRMHLMAAVIAVFGIVSCEKEGPEGPQGEQGIQGEQGPEGQRGPKGDQGDRGPRGQTGPKGDKGDKGDSGTANVIYSSWAALQHPVRDTIVDGSHMKVSEIVAPKLTQDILNNGLIMVYMRFGGTVYALPYISDAGAKPSEINFRSRAGKIFITRFAFDDSGSITLGGSLQYRYILIPGGVQATAQAGINLNEYTEVKTAFRLSD